MAPRNDENPRVAVVAPCPFFIDRGTPIRIKRLATSVAGDFAVHVLAYHQGRDGAFPFTIHRTAPLPLQIKRTGANLAKLLYDVLLLLKTLSVVKREKIRVIDGHLHEGAFIGLVVRFFTGTRVIYNAHGTFVPELVATGALRADSPLIKPLSWFESWVERRVDHIVAQSSLRRDEFIAKGIAADKVTVVEDVPELEAFSPEQGRPDRELEARLRPLGEKLLIYSGGMETYQGVDFLLEAFAHICRKRNDVRLILFGRPLAEYRVMAAELGVADNTVFVDDEPFERLPQYLWLCQAGFALRLYGENVPGKLPIYLASGIPVVGTDIKGITTVITHGENGIVVPPGDLAALEEQICWLLDNPVRAKEIGDAGRREALRRYSPEEVRRELGRVYSELLDDERSQA